MLHDYHLDSIGVSPNNETAMLSTTILPLSTAYSFTTFTTLSLHIASFLIKVLLVVSIYHRLLPCSIHLCKGHMSTFHYTNECHKVEHYCWPNLLYF